MLQLLQKINYLLGFGWAKKKNTKPHNSSSSEYKLFISQQQYLTKKKKKFPQSNFPRGTSKSKSVNRRIACLWPAVLNASPVEELSFTACLHLIYKFYVFWWNTIIILSFSPWHCDTKPWTISPQPAERVGGESLALFLEGVCCPKNGKYDFCFGSWMSPL